MSEVLGSGTDTGSVVDSCMISVSAPSKDATEEAVLESDEEFPPAVAMTPIITAAATTTRQPDFFLSFFFGAESVCS